jgi:hypothetical protein
MYTSFTIPAHAMPYLPLLHTSVVIHETNPLSQADDELDLPYLAGFEWDKEVC